MYQVGEEIKVSNDGVNWCVEKFAFFVDGEIGGRVATIHLDINKGDESATVRVWEKGKYPKNTGFDLIGCLCGVSDESQEDAENNAINISEGMTAIIIGYNEDSETYDVGFDTMSYASIIDAKVIKEILAKHEEQ